MPKEPIVERFNTTKSNKTVDTNKWWTLPKDKVHESVVPYIKRLRQAQSYRRIQQVNFAKLYQNQPLTGAGSFGQSADDVNNTATSNMAYNVVKSAIDTAIAKVAKNRPRTMFLTEKGSSSQQRRAKLLTQYIDGVFDDMDIYRKGAQAAKDAATINLGVLKFYADEENGKICCERVIPDEICVDDNEGMYGSPGQMHQIKYVFKDVLAEMYPEHRSQIEETAPAFETNYHDPDTRDMVIVIESWKLPSTPSSKDGRHAISIENVTLMEEAYDKSYFPFVFFRWTERLTGFWGMGIAEELYGVQLEINKLLRTVQLAQHYIAVPRVLVNAATRINTSHINNRVGSIVKHAGPEPKFVSAQAMSSEIYQYIRWLIQSAFEQVGISQLSATGKKPSGLDAAVALREYQDIETERFALNVQAYEKMYLQAAEIVIDMSRDLFANRDIPVKFGGADFLRELTWKDVSLPKDKYVMRLFPTNILPTQPAAKLQKALELFQAGIITRDDFGRLVDYPDLSQVMGLNNASDDLILAYLDDIIEDGVYNPPEPGMNPERAVLISQQKVLEEKRKGLEPEKLELLQRWNTKALEMSQATQPPEPAPTEALMAQPEPLPTSPMVPQAPLV